MHAAPQNSNMPINAQPSTHMTMNIIKSAQITIPIMSVSV